MNLHLPPAAVRPVVAITADRGEFHGHAIHQAFDSYLRAVHQAAGALPLLLPAAGAAIDAASLIAAVDGVVLTGGPTNVQAQRYGAEPLPPTTLTDPDRDDTVLPLLPALVAAGVPVLAVCRGFQEFNVAFGGTLERAVHAQKGRLDHREGDHDRPIERWYDDAHEVALTPGGLLARLAGATHAKVNSLHHQGVDRLAPGLRIEAIAPDGLVEAFTVADAPGFTLAVQWHPEMRVGDSPLAHAIFAAFGKACHVRRARRLAA
ncbi:gamma-glutamyl-gamma-aminobutyrate hydrolase family protein [Variovorax sp. J2P1-59]|uniref:gamma-glutamyl-gamma-aminobutyrate hydrolase family protein n=1 Tax=Variovorax flavidus TaxID=3053501 RepID=UPI002577E441|nr:gamma-glutamyl-gamma-aminobutyrate hydrolase family protein [Variovorax sp. J2P1-59]MDM0078092.1 gamma-glutamyl-gamma-aminobutyrate hydrolase family protein [Variovorax sp. J2P1-59]